jgi:hypothetical protein
MQFTMKVSCISRPPAVVMVLVFSFDKSSARFIIYETVGARNARTASNQQRKDSPMVYKEIPLTKGYVTIVDEADYDWLNQWNWHVTTNRHHAYAARWITPITNPKIGQRMHRIITGVPVGLEVDHIDGDGLNNRRDNLRICTKNENQWNRRTIIGVSKYHGVGWKSGSKKWRARIQSHNNQINLGYFSSEIEAAKAYNEAAKVLHGEFAYLNIIPVAARCTHK